MGFKKLVVEEYKEGMGYRPEDLGNRRKHDCPTKTKEEQECVFPTSVFPEEVFPRELFPWGDEEDDDTDSTKEDENL